jgi:hypothetical protein
MQSHTKLKGLSDILLIDGKRTNPHAQEAQQKAKEYCKEAGIYLDNFDGYNSMCAFLYPDATAERLTAVIIIMNFLYYVDEVYERHARQQTDRTEDLYLREVFDNCTRIMLYGIQPTSEHELYKACSLIHKVVIPLSNVEWLQQFIFVTLQHLKATTYTLEDILKTKGGDPIQQYMDLRVLDCGMRPTMRLIEFANDFYLPEEIKAHSFIHSVEEPTGNIAGLMNDLFSYEKEVIAFGSRFNLVALLEDYRGLNFEGAVDQAVEIVNRFTRDFLECEKAIPDFGSDEVNKMVQQYVQALHDQINATWQWQISTDRYRSRQSPFPELRDK